MDLAEFEALKATFPWQEVVYQTPQGGLVQVIDNQGREVPIFTMTKFLVMITHKLAVKPEQSKEAA